MAKGKGSGSTRLVAVAGVTAFMAGCWIGMGSEASGDVYCVVTAASAPARAGFAPGQLVPQPDDDAGCQPGEPMVCGRYEPATGEDRRFESDSCP
jgi:hypothetical protein